MKVVFCIEASSGYACKLQVGGAPLSPLERMWTTIIKLDCMPLTGLSGF